MSFLSALNALLSLNEEIKGQYKPLSNLHAYARKLGRKPKLTRADLAYFDSMPIAKTKANLNSNLAATKAALSANVAWPTCDSMAKFQAVLDAVQRHGAGSPQAARAILAYYVVLTTHEKALQDLRATAETLHGPFKAAKLNHAALKTIASELSSGFEGWAKVPFNDAHSTACFVHSRNCFDISVSAGKLAPELGKVADRLRVAIKEADSRIQQNRDWIDWVLGVKSKQKAEAKAAAKSGGKGGTAGKGSVSALGELLKKNSRAQKPKR